MELGKVIMKRFLRKLLNLNIWGGTSYGDGFIESNSGIQTIEVSGDPDIPNYLNVVLDTATLLESNHVYPSWGCIEVTVIPK